MADLENGDNRTPAPGEASTEESVSSAGAGQGSEAASPEAPPKTSWWGRVKRKFSGKSAETPEASQARSEAPETQAETQAEAPQAPETTLEPEAPAAATAETPPAPEQIFEPESPAAAKTETPQAPERTPAAEASAAAKTETPQAPERTPEPIASADAKAETAQAPEQTLELETPAAAKAETAQTAPDASQESAKPAQTPPSEESEAAAKPFSETPSETIKEEEKLAEADETADAAETAEEEEEAPAEKKLGWLGRLKLKLTATREALSGRLEKVLSAVRHIDEDVLEELEEIMITSDLGVKTTNDILQKIRGQVARKELKDVDALKRAIKARMIEMITIPIPPEPNVRPLVILMVGVNGVGKTTTIAKLARRYKSEGRKVMLAAGDTFRAAAVEQLTIWAKRLEIDIIAQPTGADPSAVVFDSLTAAKARGADVVLIDTAGRLHTKSNLMEELKKIKRVAGKAMEGAPHETVLVLDANTGQNAVSQAALFHEAIGIDRLIITKLDGTSKGGVIVSIIHERRLPVAFIGLGESYEDLRPFDPEAFVEAILETE